MYNLHFFGIDSFFVVLGPLVGCLQMLLVLFGFMVGGSQILSGWQKNKTSRTKRAEQNEQNKTSVSVL